MSLLTPLRSLFSSLRTPRLRGESLTVTSRVDDSPGWSSNTGSSHDYDPAQVQEIYASSLEAWRKNPIAWRIIAITTDYVIGDQIVVSSPNRSVNRFIRNFWTHRKNMMDLRLESLCDELSRSGDLFILLFRNPQDGMSYIRTVTKDQIKSIQTAPNDWETELSYTVFSPPLGEGPGVGSSPPSLVGKRLGVRYDETVWISPYHPDAATSNAIMIHYAVNRPAGALLGESDLTTMLPWLQRYSRMLEDRVRLNWALRAFLWIVTVPANKVKEKQEQYRNPPDAGSIIVKDESETWEAQSPILHAIDAARDLQAVRQMIDAGAGYPPHWRGEAGDANLATATAMQGPTERHLLRRQTYFRWMLQDILYHAYQRSAELGFNRPLPMEDYDRYFHLLIPDISRWDNESLSRAARDVSLSFQNLANNFPILPPTLTRYALRLTSTFAGKPLTDTDIDQIMTELKSMPAPSSPPPYKEGAEDRNHPIF